MRYYRKMIESFITIDDDEWASACEGFRQVTIKKGTMVHQSGEVFKDIWFIKSGLARSYFIDLIIVHTDQGSQYISDAYLLLLKTWGIKPSMSRRGNCWDNAVAESFFASLKKERVFDADYRNQTEARFDIADYIGWYNHRRLHSTLGYESPEDCEKAYRDRISQLTANI